MDHLGYKKLYELQDKVLKIVFETENEFYLTGGTCLSRFYHEKRYSDDLDFFTNHSSRYSFAVKNIKRELQKIFDLDVKTDTKSFIRFKINKVLQLDFVDDISERYKEVVVLDNGIIIDNILNILSNKLTAILGRDNPKDIFDIFLISKFSSFSWSEVLGAAHRKASFSDEDLIIRLKSFPFSLFKSINLVDESFLNSFESEFPVIIEEVNQKFNHLAIENDEPYP